MHLNKNIVANYMGIGVTTAMNFIVVPFYLNWLGKESYGLIGMATLLQTWMVWVTSGFTPIVGRVVVEAVADYPVRPPLWQQAVAFIKTVDTLVLGVFTLLILCLLGIKNDISAYLGEAHLPESVINNSVFLLILGVFIRLASYVSRSVLMHLENQVWLNGHIILNSTLRFGASLPLVYYYPQIEILFMWWLVVAIWEYVSLQYKMKQLLPVHVPYFAFNGSLLLAHKTMIMRLMWGNGLWIIATNVDKLILLGMLSLADYGYFSIAVLLSSSVLIVAQPIIQAFQPRLIKAYLEEGGKSVAFFFTQCSRWVTVCVLPVGAVLFAMPETVLYLWTHDIHMAHDGAGMLRGYVLGSTLAALTTLLYALQVASGRVAAYVWGNLSFAVLSLINLPWVVREYGALGAAWLWAGLNAILFLVWSGVILKKIARPLPPQWLWRDILAPLFLSFLLAYMGGLFFTRFDVSPFFLCIIVILFTLMISGLLWQYTALFQHMTSKHDAA